MAFDYTNYLEVSSTMLDDFIFVDRDGNTQTSIDDATPNGDWCRDTNTTSSSNTGPSGPPSGRAAYVYTETSAPSASDLWVMRRDTTFDSTTQNVYLDILYSRNIENASEFYIEYATIASPNDTTDWTILETISGTYGTDDWISDTFDFSSIETTTLHIRIRYNSTNDYRNDLAFSTWREYSTDKTAALSRAFARNTGARQPGTIQRNDFAIGVNLDYASSGLEWWMGPNENSKIIIAKMSNAENIETSVVGDDAWFIFDGVDSESDFIDYANIELGEAYTTLEEARHRLSMESNFYIPKWIHLDHQLNVNFWSAACGSLLCDGNMYTWGNNNYGILGDNTTTDKSTPVYVYNSNDEHFYKMSIGGFHSLALNDEGELYSWGRNNSGQLGHYNYLSVSTPYSVTGGYYSYNKISAGYEHSLGLTSEGQIWAWGLNSSGQLGINSAADECSPAIGANKTFCEISTGFYSSFAIDYNGQAWAWGTSSTGSLGVGNTLPYSTPTAICGTHTFCKIVTGGGSLSSFTLGLDNNNLLWAWGENGSGRLGINSELDISTPAAVCYNMSFCSIAVGYNFSLGLRNNGALYAWGSNSSGQLGTNSITSRSLPIVVYGDHTFCSISTGRYTSFAVDNNGLIWSWGSGASGILGNNTTTSVSTPVMICYF